MMPYEVEFYRAEKERLQSIGYVFEITSSGYTVKHGERWVSGAGVASHKSRRTTKMKTADLREYLGCAVRAAQDDEVKTKTEVPNV